MTVEHYSARFMELARFVANLIPDKESKAERFENDLNPRIKERVIHLEIKDYARLVEVACCVNFNVLASARIVCNIAFCKCEVEPTRNCVAKINLYSI
jgi:hypothetical protein